MSFTFIIIDTDFIFVSSVSITTKSFFQFLMHKENSFFKKGSSIKNYFKVTFLSAIVTIFRLSFYIQKQLYNTFY